MVHHSELVFFRRQNEKDILFSTRQVLAHRNCI
jgi:hypothetical protein